MNRNRFKRKLNSAKKNGFLSLYFVEKLFDEKRSFFNNEKTEKLIEDNFATIMAHIGSENIDSLIETLYEHREMRPFLEKKETIKEILDNVDYTGFEIIINNSSIKENAQNFIQNNIGYVLRKYNMKKIVSAYECVKFEKKQLEAIDEYFNGKKQEFLSETLTKTLSFKGNVKKEQLNTLLEIVTNFVDKILEKENCKIIDIKILLNGGFSNVLRIGDTIIKVGIPRETFNIPNDKRILQPHLRIDLEKDYGIAATIEVSDRVDTDISLNEDELYEIYKDMRDRGIVCGDFKYDNIGKLLKSNTPHDEDELYKIYENMRGKRIAGGDFKHDNIGDLLDSNKPRNGMIGSVTETLNVGNYVMFDTDFIYKEGDSRINLTSPLSRKFEARYNKQLMDIGKSKSR